jgi:hypothetical protein
MNKLNDYLDANRFVVRKILGAMSKYWIGRRGTQNFTALTGVKCLELITTCFLGTLSSKRK